ncbi:hypothetical protein QR680_002172 [Steinernema hermaphroditum]|uniref:Uncharacterized protein n=1 Tax=Steinernema hermaphroditum TaxID=289476 RepID=A0AA39LHP7_9BILA|nr:hypothetical protein QR680_002172 [Steinernema hermaphroditum]
MLEEISSSKNRAQYYIYHAEKVYFIIKQTVLDRLEDKINSTGTASLLTVKSVPTVFLSRVALETGRRRRTGQDVYLHEFAYIRSSAWLGNKAHVVGHAMQLPYLFMPEEHFIDNRMKCDWDMAHRMTEHYDWCRFSSSGIPSSHLHRPIVMSCSPSHLPHMALVVEDKRQSRHDRASYHGVASRSNRSNQCLNKTTVVALSSLS